MDLTDLSLDKIIEKFGNLNIKGENLENNSDFNNTEVLNEFLNKVKGIIIPLLFYFGVSEYEIEDLSVEILYEVYKSINKFKKKSKFETFLFKIVKNQISIYYRKKNKEKEHISNLQSEEVYIKDRNIEDIFFNNEMKVKINLLLQKMPDEYSICLFKKYFEEKSLKVISEELDISLSLVKVRLHRGKKWIKKRLKID